ncbi:DUF3653 domain-containing protein [Pseudomonas sp. CGJS7]|uniref:DUF3653 domain-containing protein n=1 Tax=Pseudomonas sp. CGJS7 TaxID=3109348 RepID=UPI0030095CE9
MQTQETKNHFNLNGPWIGWRVRGRDLVSPEGERVNPERLRGLLWRDENNGRVAAARSRKAAAEAARERQPVKVVVVSLGEYRANGLAVG